MSVLELKNWNMCNVSSINWKLYTSKLRHLVSRAMPFRGGLSHGQFGAVPRALEKIGR